MRQTKGFESIWALGFFLSLKWTAFQNSSVKIPEELRCGHRSTHHSRTYLKIGWTWTNISSFKQQSSTLDYRDGPTNLWLEPSRSSQVGSHGKVRDQLKIKPWDPAYCEFSLAIHRPSTLKPPVYLTSKRITWTSDWAVSTVLQLDAPKALSATKTQKEEDRD